MVQFCPIILAVIVLLLQVVDQLIFLLANLAQVRRLVPALTVVAFFKPEMVDGISVSPI